MLPAIRVKTNYERIFQLTNKINQSQISGNRIASDFSYNFVNGSFNRVINLCL